MGAKKFSGPDKAAIVFMALGEELAGQIAANLSPHELKRIGLALGRMGRIDASDVDQVLADFQTQLTTDTKGFVGGSGSARRLLAAATRNLDPQSRAALEKQLDSASPALTETLERFDARMLATYLKNEHPQTMALILAHCDAKKCGDVFKLLPESLHTELLLRIARLESVDPEVLHELDETLRKEEGRLTMTRQSKIGGVEHVAALLNTLDKPTEQSFLDAISLRDPDLLEGVKKLMFRFVDLVKLDQRGMQELLKHVKPQSLKLALKSCPETVRKAILGAMSQRAATLLEEDLASLPKVRMSEVEAAQSEIAQLARRLADEGKIALKDASEVYV